MKRLALLVALVSLGYPFNVLPRDHFNSALLENNRPEIKGVDLSSFENGMQRAGKYRVEIILNNDFFASKDINFSNGEDGELTPCLSMDFLKNLGVLVANFPELKETDGCVNFKVISQASANYDLSSQELQLSIPQAALSQKVRGFVDPSLWDEGIPAFLLNYSISGDETKNDAGGTTNSQYARILPGINIGPWRFRNYSSINHDDVNGTQVDSVYTYVQRDIKFLSSQLTMGDSNTPSDIFDSVAFRGTQLATDEDMKPDSLRGYAPVVRGIAKSNAQVMIKQNGYIIYQSYVPAGSFEINDLYPTGQGGDLTVTVKEQDGSTQEFVVPYASLPLLQREKSLKYSVTAGQYRPSNSDVEKTPFVQGTAIYGLPWGITIYGGVQNAKYYNSLAIGLGRNLGIIGAISVDVIAAKSELNDSRSESGRSFRVRYSKDFVDTGTNFAIAGYRYSTEGFYNLQEVLESYGNEDAMPNRRRDRAEISLTQSLGENLGSITGNAVQEKYWNNDEKLKSYSFSYNNSFSGVTYSIVYSLNKNTTANNGDGTTYNENSLMLNVNIPLSRFLPDTWASYNLNNSEHGGATQTIGLSGSALEENNLTWNMQQTKDRESYSGSFMADYRGALAETNLGYNYSPDSQQINYGISGGVVIHSGGVTLSQPLGETIAIVEAKGAKGAGIYNQAGSGIDRFGYAVMNSLSPYRKNDISLDPGTFSDNVEVEDNGVTVTPTKGAVVKARFNSHYGYKALVTLKNGSGYVPFGAMVNLVGGDNSDEQSFIVGDLGQVYISGLKSEKGSLLVRWGNDANNNCKSHYNLVGQPSAGNMYKTTATCE